MTPEEKQKQEEEEKACRIIIYPEDVQRLTKKSIRHSRGLLAKARQKLGLKKGELVTYKHFAFAMGWDEANVKKALKVSIWIPFVVGVLVWVFRDDLDLAMKCFLAWAMFIFFGEGLKPSVRVVKGWFRR